MMKVRYDPGCGSMAMIVVVLVSVTVTFNASPLTVARIRRPVYKNLL